MAFGASFLLGAEPAYRKRDTQGGFLIIPPCLLVIPKLEIRNSY